MNKRWKGNFLLEMLLLFCFVFQFILGEDGHLLLVCKQQLATVEQFKDSEIYVYMCLDMQLKQSICGVEIQISGGHIRNMSFTETCFYLAQSYELYTWTLSFRLQTILQGRNSHVHFADDETKVDEQLS